MTRFYDIHGVYDIYDSFKTQVNCFQVSIARFGGKLPGTILYTKPKPPCGIPTGIVPDSGWSPNLPTLVAIAPGIE